jgi:hypothetical protein
MFRFEGLCAVLRGLLHYMIPPNGCIISFFQIFTMCKMVICSMYIIWKKFLHCQDYIKRLDFIYYNNIILYISNNTRILLIPPMNTTHTTLKKLVVQINLNRQILTYRSFSITYESFSTGGTGWYCVP